MGTDLRDNGWKLDASEMKLLGEGKAAIVRVGAHPLWVEFHNGGEYILIRQLDGAEEGEFVEMSFEDLDRIYRGCLRLQYLCRRTIER